VSVAFLKKPRESSKSTRATRLVPASMPPGSNRSLPPSQSSLICGAVAKP